MKNIGTSVKVFLANNLCGDTNGRETSPSAQDVYEVCPRKNQDGFDLISDALPYGPLWYRGPNAIRDAIGHVKFYSRSHDTVIRVTIPRANVIETHEQAGDFKVR